jgi:dihydropteroate synthase
VVIILPGKQEATDLHYGGNWKLAHRMLEYGTRTLVMGVLNVTPDSFSDGGAYFDLESAAAHAEQMFEEGADILDIGGESSRPGAVSVSVQEEIRRVVPVIAEVVKRTGRVISVDTAKSEVAEAAIGAGAEIINDISGLRFDPKIGEIAARSGAGLVLMHSQGTFATMHTVAPGTDIIEEITAGLANSVMEAERTGVATEAIAVDPGIGFGKSLDQNLRIIAELSHLIGRFSRFPMLVGTSRKRFIGRILGNVGTDERLHGTMATVTAAVLNGAHIVRVHDVKAAVQTVKVADEIRKYSGSV